MHDISSSWWSGWARRARRDCAAFPAPDLVGHRAEAAVTAVGSRPCSPHRPGPRRPPATTRLSPGCVPHRLSGRPGPRRGRPRPPEPRSPRPAPRPPSATVKASRTAAAAPSKSAALTPPARPGGGPAEFRPPGATVLSASTGGRRQPWPRPGDRGADLPALGTFATVPSPTRTRCAWRTTCSPRGTHRDRRGCWFAAIRTLRGPTGPLVAWSRSAAPRGGGGRRLDAAQFTGGRRGSTCGPSLARLGDDRDFALAVVQQPACGLLMPQAAVRRSNSSRHRPAVRIPAGWRSTRARPRRWPRPGAGAIVAARAAASGQPGR